MNKVPLSIRIARRGLQWTSYIAPQAAARWAARIFTSPQRFSRDERENTLLRSGNPLSLPGHLRAWSWGQGPKIFLAHGWSGRGTQFSSFVEPLVKAGFEVIAWDAPAHGDSPGKQTNIGDYVRAWMEAQKTLGPFRGVVGHSFGAAAAVLAVSRGLEANRLVLISCPCAAQDLCDQFTGFLKLSRSARDRFQAIVERAAGIKVEDAQVSLLGPQLTTDVLLIHDRLDKEIPVAEAYKIAGSWKAARLSITEGLGHRRILASKEVVDQVVSFFSSAAPTRT